MHRPHADYLQEGIYELRTRVGRVNYRILYFFHGQEAVVLSQGFTKEKDVPKAEIEKAIANREVFEKNPKRHTEEVSAKE